MSATSQGPRSSETFPAPALNSIEELVQIALGEVFAIPRIKIFETFPYINAKRSGLAHLRSKQTYGFTHCFIRRRKATITDVGQYERLVIRTEVHFHVYSLDETPRPATRRCTQSSLRLPARYQR